MKTACAIGSRVALTAQHWLRPYEKGIIVEQQQRAVKKWLVQFDAPYSGGGIDGDKLWCDESDFEEVTAPLNSVPRRSHEVAELPLREATRLSSAESGELLTALEAG